MIKKTRINVTSIVRNEEKWIWYSIMSVLNYADNMLIYDTGSTDNTVRIIKSIKDPKITLKLKGAVDSKGFVFQREEQLHEIDYGWIIILDGDEVYPDDTIKSLVEEINKAPDTIDCIALRFYNCVGDIFHYNPKGGYKILGQTGNLTIRAFRRNIPGLHFGGLYNEGTEGLCDANGTLIQDRTGHVKIIDKYFFHMHDLRDTRPNDNTMRRSSSEKWPTYSFRTGKRFNKGVNLPEVFYKTKPLTVSLVTKKLPHYLSVRNGLIRFYKMKKGEKTNP